MPTILDQLEQFGNDFIDTSIRGIDKGTSEFNLNGKIVEITKLAKDERYINAVLDDLNEATEADIALEKVNNIYQLELPPEPVYPEVNHEFISKIENRGRIIGEIRAMDLQDNPDKYPTKNLSTAERVANMIKNSFYEKRTKKDQINYEAETIGESIFQASALPEGVTVKFICQDAKNWFAIYKLPESYPVQDIILHYELMSEGILKCTSQGGPVVYITGKEAADFDRATEYYLQLFLELYNYDVSSDKIVT